MAPAPINAARPASVVFWLAPPPVSAPPMGNCCVVLGPGAPAWVAPRCAVLGSTSCGPIGAPARGVPGMAGPGPPGAAELAPLGLLDPGPPVVPVPLGATVGVPEPLGVPVFGEPDPPGVVALLGPPEPLGVPAFDVPDP